MINLVLSSHRINNAQVCLRLYYYTHELLLAPIKKSVYYDEGEVMHYLLRLFYQKLQAEEVPDEKLIIEMGKNFAAKNTQVESSVIESTCNDFKMYIDFYGKDTNWIILGVEQPFAKPLFENDEIRIIITGTSDLIVRTNRGNGPIVVVDHKYEAQFRKKSDRDNQPLTYCWAIGTRDFLFNKIGKQQSYKPKDRLKREPYFQFGKHQIDEWIQTTIHTAIEIIRSHKLDFYPARYAGCNMWGRKCTFHDVCNTTESNRQYKLDTFFTKSEPYDKKLMDKE